MSLGLNWEVGNVSSSLKASFVRVMKLRSRPRPSSMHNVDGFLFAWLWGVCFVWLCVGCWLFGLFSCFLFVCLFLVAPCC